MRKIFFVFLLSVIAVSFTGCSLLNKTENTQPVQDQTTVVPNEELDEVSLAQVYTLEEIALHNKPEDCWLLVENKVYDVTNFIASGNHGGGDAILAGCGIDATQLFNTRPMGSNTPHSDKARSFLPSFYIGEFQP